MKIIYKVVMEPAANSIVLCIACELYTSVTQMFFVLEVM